MTLKIGWLHEAEHSLGTWLHEADDWHPCGSGRRIRDCHLLFLTRLRSILPTANARQSVRIAGTTQDGGQR
jgi:hypothetical protein